MDLQVAGFQVLLENTYDSRTYLPEIRGSLQREIPRELLKNLGLSYQKARFAVGGKDPENILKRKVWLATWPEIVKKARNRMHISCSVMGIFPSMGNPHLYMGPVGGSLLYPLQVSAGYKVFGRLITFPAIFFIKLWMDDSIPNHTKLFYGIF